MLLQTAGVVSVPHNAAVGFYTKLVDVAMGNAPATCLAAKLTLKFEPESLQSPKRRRTNPRMLALEDGDAAMALEDEDGDTDPLEEDLAHGPETPPDSPPMAAPLDSPADSPLPLPPLAIGDHGEVDVPAVDDDVGERRAGAELRAGGRRQKQEKTHHWGITGAFAVLYRPAGADRDGRPTRPAWQATCPFKPHNIPGKPKCTRTQSFEPDDDNVEEIVMWKQRLWCNWAVHCRDKKEHHDMGDMIKKMSLAELPDEAEIYGGQPGEVLPDEFVQPPDGFIFGARSSSRGTGASSSGSSGMPAPGASGVVSSSSSSTGPLPAPGASGVVSSSSSSTGPLPAPGASGMVSSGSSGPVPLAVPPAVPPAVAVAPPPTSSSSSSSSSSD